MSEPTKTADPVSNPDRMTMTDEECYSIIHGPEYSNYGQLRAAFRAGVERGLAKAAEIARKASDEVADMLRLCETSVHVGAVQRLASMVAAIERQRGKP
jgi:hypothetical protein